MTPGPGPMSLGFFPTPLAELPRLSEALGGPRILAKRDDLTGLAFGGNKTRKLEFLLADALEKGCDTLVTGGAAQSNHCRQTAAAAARAGLSCHLALGGSEPPRPEGNLFLDRLLGAEIHWFGEDRKGEGMHLLAEELSRLGKRPCVIPYGGSSALGALGFAAAAGELKEQLDAAGERADAVAFATSSGGTQAGLAAGSRLHGLNARLVGVAVDKELPGEEPYRERLARLASECAALLGSRSRFHPADFEIREEYLGEGYGRTGPRDREAILLAARLEGLILDPVYTGKAMSGLVDMIRRGEIRAGETVVFWHTGGAPALFASADVLLRP